MTVTVSRSPGFAQNQSRRCDHRSSRLCLSTAYGRNSTPWTNRQLTKKQSTTSQQLPFSNQQRRLIWRIQSRRQLPPSSSFNNLSTPSQPSVLHRSEPFEIKIHLPKHGIIIKRRSGGHSHTDTKAQRDKRRSERLCFEIATSRCHVFPHATHERTNDSTLADRTP